MSEGTIDNLVIEVSSNAAGASDGLSNLVGILDKLEKSTGSGFSKLKEVSDAVGKLKNNSSNLNFSKLKELSEVKVSGTLAKNLAAVANSVNALPSDTLSKIQPLVALKDLNSINISKSNATNLALLGDAIRRVPADARSRLEGVAYSLLPLKWLNGLNIKSAMNQLRQLPEVMKLYKSLDVKAFVAQMQLLNSQLRPMASNIYALGSAVNSLPTSMRTAGAAARSLAASNKYLTTTNVTARRSTLNLAAAFGAALVGGRKLINIVSKCINETNSYIENMNLFEASMGAGTQAATEFGMKCQELLGIDFGEWARNQGVFQTLITGMGLASNKATIMSQQLTQLGYDIASFYNISTEDAMTKLQSGIAGELEPLRRLGWDLSNARMNLELSKMGIDANAQSMTQAEKVALRYYLIMNQVTITHGDMARTIASPANQLRVLKAQLTLAARAIGNLLIPAMNQILPVAIAAAKAVRLLAQEIANLFNLDITFEVDYSGLDTSGILSTADDADDAASALEDATDAAEKYKNTVMGFDELNKLNDTPDSSDKDKNKGIGLDLPIDTYDFLSGLTDEIGARTDALAERMAEGFKRLLPIVLAIGAAIGAWKLLNMLGALEKLNIGFGQFMGVIMAVAGAVGLVWFWLDAIANGINLTNFLGMLGSAILLVTGLGLLFGTKGAGIGLIIAGIAFVTAALKDAYDNGLNFVNLGTLLLGLTAIIVGVGLAFGPVAAAVAAVASGVTLLVVGFYDIMNNGMTYENFAAIAAGFLLVGAAIGFLLGGPVGLLVGAIVGAVAAIVTAIVANWDWLCENIFGPIGQWFDQNVIQPLTNSVQGFCEKWNQFWTWAGETWAGFCSDLQHLGQDLMTAFNVIGDAVGKFMSDPIGVIKAAWQAMGDWFYNTVIYPIQSFFANLINFIIDKVNFVANGINNLPIVGGFINLPTLSRVSTPQRVSGYATGGFPERGELFIARENGAPEMVGKMGSSTTVANNEQIVDGIKAGVFEAMMAALASGGFGSNESGPKEFAIYIDRDELARQTYKGIENLERRGELRFA